MRPVVFSEGKDWAAVSEWPRGLQVPGSIFILRTGNADQPEQAGSHFIELQGEVPDEAGDRCLMAHVFVLTHLAFAGGRADEFLAVRARRDWLKNCRQYFSGQTVPDISVQDFLAILGAGQFVRLTPEWCLTALWTPDDEQAAADWLRFLGSPQLTREDADARQTAAVSN